MCWSNPMQTTVKLVLTATGESYSILLDRPYGVVRTLFQCLAYPALAFHSISNLFMNKEKS